MAGRKKHAEHPVTSSPGPLTPAGYTDFLAGIKQQIRQRQYRALRAVNHELVALYWELGEAICRKQEEHGWGRSVVENLARDLQAEFPGRNGFSPQNIWMMRQFYLEYRDKPDLAPLVREISWVKNRVILGRCKDDLAREYFIELLLFRRRSASSSAKPGADRRAAQGLGWVWGRIVRVHPALVAGRVRKECGNYRLLSEVANCSRIWACS